MNNNLLKEKTNEELFDIYRASNDIEVKQELVTRYSWIVKTIAVQLRGVYISFTELDDVVNEGIITLMQAVDKFDVSKNVKFESYASLRVRGAIVDMARKQDWVPRNVRRLGKEIDKAYTDLYYELGRTPSDVEVADKLGMPVDKYQKALGQTNLFNVLSLDALVDGMQDEGTHEKFLKDQSIENMPAYNIEKQELHNMLTGAIEQLGENEKIVISLYYQKELNMKDIARVMNISEPRVSQLHSSAIKKLRVNLGNYYTI